MRRVLLLLFSLLLIFAGTLSVLAQATMPSEVNDGKPITLKVFGLPNLTDALNVGAKAEMAAAREFMRRYPNVTLKPFTFLTVPGGGQEGGSAIDTDTNTLMAMAAGIAPEVFTTNFRQSDTFIQQGFLLPLDKYYDDWNSTPAGRKEIEEVFKPEILKKVVWRIGPDGKKHLWAIPPDTLSMVMMYRKDILRKAGVDPEKPPKTWDEFYNMCIKVCDPRKPMYAYTLQGSWFLSWMLWSEGNKIIDTKDGKNWYADYNSDTQNNNSVEAFKFAYKLVNGPWAICPDCGEHYVLPDKARDKRERARLTVQCSKGHKYSVKQLVDKKLYFEGVCTDDFNLWGKNQIACYISYMGNMVLNTPGVDPSLIQLARVPYSPLGKSVSEINAKMYAINGTLNPRKDRGKIETAWAYIRFQCSDEAKRIKTQVYVENGFAKYLNPEWLRKFGYTAYLRQVPPQWEKMFKDSLNEGNPEPYGHNAQQIYNEMDVAWGQVRQLTVPDNAAIKKILDTNVALTNQKLMGKIPPAEKKNRDRVALGFVIISALLFLMLGRYTMATYGKALESPSQRTRAALRQVIIAWIIMLPALGAVMLFQYLPLIRGSLIAFQNYQILLKHQQWIGLTNFGNVLFAPKEFWDPMLNTVKFAAMALAMGFVAPIVLALLLHEVPRGSLFFRIVFFLPAVTSGIVVMLLWRQLYDSSSYGVLNQILSIMHIETQKFLQDPKLALFWVVVPTVWMGMGPGCIIYLAALRQIPTEYYEAADVDGAGFFAKLWTITVPFLKPLLIINFVGACVGAMKSFEQILVMTGGGPAGGTRVMGLALYQNAFMYLNYGFATAMGWILASLLIGFTMFQLRYLSKVQFKLAKSD